MGSDIPKQYLELLGKTVIEHTVERFLSHDCTKGIVVVLNQNDQYWCDLNISKTEKIMTTTGGKERCDSVLCGLKKLSGLIASKDWVMVHDAARPCLKKIDIDRLLASFDNNSAGSILASPVRDTMKRSDESGYIIETVERNKLWHALTPQAFQFDILTRALESAISQGITVTDEAQAVEILGVKPLLVQGENNNIKITHMNDLKTAEQTLKVELEC